MSGILRLESLTKGNTLKQGDKTPLKYRLFDADGEKLNIAGKSAKVRLVYPDFLTIGYEKEGLTVAQDDTVTFTIDSIIPSRIYHVEIIVDDQFIFPSRADESKFTVDKSSLGAETNIIEIVGKDILIRDVRQQVEADLQPMIDDLTEAEDDRLDAENARQQNEDNRNTAESSRVSAEAQREIDHANRSAELDSKADKVVIENLIENGNFSNGTSGWIDNTATVREVINGELLAEQAHTSTSSATIDKLGSIPLKEGHKYFVHIKHRQENPFGENRFRVRFVGGSYVDGVDYYLDETNTFIIESTSDDPSSKQHLTYQFNTSGNHVGHKMYLSDYMIIDLTQTFGAGNEPTKEEMDEFIKFIGYIDGEYALNNKEMLGYLIQDTQGEAVLADGSVTRLKLDSTLQSLLDDWESVLTNENESWVV